MDKEKLYDLIVIGGGPAGLTTGIYAGRAKLDVLILEKERAGGQITLTEEIANYPGILGTSGVEFGEELKKQAINFGIEFAIDEVVSTDFKKDIKRVITKNGEYKALSVVIATGASPRKLGFPGEDKFTGRGIAYCATCDGEFFTGMDVFVIGAGFAAAEEAVFLTKYAKQVTIIAREPEFTCAKTVADKALNNPKIQVKFNTEIIEANGDTQLRSVKFKNNKTNETFEYKAEEGKTFGIFIFVGYEPQSKLFREDIEVDKAGFILTDSDLMTNVSGVFAAGDLRPKKLRQVVTAVSDGAEVAMNVEKYVHTARTALGIEKKENTEKKIEKKEEFLSKDLKEQLVAVVERFENSIELVVLKDSKNEKSFEMEEMVKDISSVSDKIKFSSYEKGENQKLELESKVNRFPTILILNKDGEFSGIKYSAPPSGHELNSFILAMYNVAGPGQQLNENVVSKIKNLKEKRDVKIGVTLSCNNCPETVQAIQRIVTENKNISLEVIDVMTFRDFKDKHEIMSVPAVIIDDDKIYFGKKNIEGILEIL